jgi:hypothetical protein
MLGHKPLALFHFDYFRLIFTITMGSNASIMLQQEDLQNICQQTGW